MEIFSIFGSILIKTAEAENSLAKMNTLASKGQGVLDKLGNVASKVGKAMATTVATVSAGVVAGLGTSIKIGSEFESAFAGVKKTFDDTGLSAEQTKTALGDLEKGIREMSKELPETANDIAEVAESAFQLGIQRDNVLSFTKTMIDMGVSTNLSADSAATSFARFANIVGMEQTKFSNLGSSVVALGNSLATTESEIVDFSLRLAGAGKQVGLSESQIMGFSGALSSLGISSEAGGTAFSKVMSTIDVAIAQGSESIKDFANVSKMSVSEFSNLWEKDAGQAMVAFINGLSKVKEEGGNVAVTLDELGFKESRLIDMLTRASGSNDLFSKSLEISNQAFAENNALTEEATVRYKTLESRLQVFKNKITDLGISIYESISEPLSDIVNNASETIDELIQIFENEGAKGLVSALAEIIANLIQSASEEAPKLIEIGFTFIKSIMKGLTENSDEILVAIGSLIASIAESVIDLIPQILEIGREIAQGLIDGLLEAVPQLEGLADIISSTFLPAVENIIPAIAGLIAGLKTFEIVTAIVTGINTLSTAFVAWKATTEGATIAQKLLNTVMAANPFILITTAVVALGTALIVLYNTNGTFRDKVNEAWDSVKDKVMPIIEVLKQGILFLGEVIFSFIKNTLTVFKSDFISIFTVIKNLFTGFLDVAINVISGVVDIFISFVGIVNSIIHGDFKSALNGFIDIFNSVFITIGEIFTGAITIFFSLGADIITGLINGIKSRVNAVAETISDVVNSTVNKAKAILKIQSPSKVFEEEVGAMIGAGMAIGIDKSSKKSVKAAEKLSKNTFKAAKTWIENYRNEEEYLAEEEIKMWEYLSTAYTKVSKEKVEIDKNIIKLKEELQQEDYDNSKNWIDKRKFYNLMSAEEEVASWERLSNRLINGTKQKEEAERNLYTARQNLEQETFNNSKKWVDTRKYYGLLNLKEEEEAYERMQKRYIDGTKHKEEVDKSLFEVRKKIAEEEQNFEEESLKLSKQYEDAVNSRANTIYSSYNLFSEVKKKEADEDKVTSEELTNNLKNQVEELNNWRNNLDTLSKKGMDNNLLKELEQMGVSANEEIKALTSMSEGELDGYVGLWKEKHKLAREQATKELAPLKDDINKEIDNLLLELEEKIGNKTSSIGNELFKNINVAIKNVNSEALEDDLISTSGENTEESDKEMSKIENIFKTRFANAKELAMAELKEFTESTNELIKTMLKDVDTVLNNNARTIGYNFFKLLGEGLILAEGELLALALGVATSIREIYEAQKRASEDSDGSFAKGISYVPFDNFKAVLHKGERVLTANENREFSNNVNENEEKNNVNINQYFYNIKEEQTAFEVYRQSKKAIDEVMT